MSTQFLSGATGKVIVGTNKTMNVEGWSFEPEADFLETTHSGSGGYEEGMFGIKRAKGSFKATWDANARPTASPPNLNPGVIVALKLYLSTGGYVDITQAGIISLPIVSEVKGLVSFTCNFRVIGSWTMPQS